MLRTLFTAISNTIWPTNQTNQPAQVTRINDNNKREREDDHNEQKEESSNKRVKVHNGHGDHDCVRCSYLTVQISDLRDEMKGMQSLHQSCLCAICQHLLIEPVTLDCSHSFCSVCCLKALHRVRQCPLCRQRVDRVSKPSIQLKTLITHLVGGMNNEEQTERLVEEASRMRSQLVDGAKIEQQFAQLFGNHDRIGPRRAPIYDSADEIWRCPYCAFELAEGEDCCHPLDWSEVLDEEELEQRASRQRVQELDSEANDDEVEIDVSDDYESDLDPDTRHALEQAERRLSDRARYALVPSRAFNRRGVRRRDSIDEDELDGGVREVFRAMIDADERDVVDDDENVELPYYVNDEVQEFEVARPSQQSYADFLDIEAQFSDTEDFDDPADDENGGIDDFEAEFEAQFQQAQDEDDEDEAEYQ